MSVVCHVTTRRACNFSSVFSGMWMFGIGKFTSHYFMGRYFTMMYNVSALIIIIGFINMVILHHVS